MSSQSLKPQEGLPLNAARTAQGTAASAQKNNAALLTTGIATAIKTWRTEKDVVRDFPQVARQLDSLCRNGNGKDLFNLYNLISKRLLDLEYEIWSKNGDLHRTIWEQTVPNRTETRTFAALFLTLPRMGNVPLAMPALFPKTSGNTKKEKELNELKDLLDRIGRVDHDEVVAKMNAVLEEAGRGGVKFVGIASYVKKDWLEKFASRYDITEAEKHEFFEKFRKAYLEPGKKAMAPASAPAESMQRIVPVKTLK